MFSRTVSNGSARLLGLIICTSSTFGSATWILGGDGESCSRACSNISQVCTEAEMMRHNGNVSSESEMRHVSSNVPGMPNCTKYNAKYGQTSDVPVYQASSGECYMSAPDREIGSFKCDRAPPSGKQRLCWCHNAGSPANSSSPAKSAEAVVTDEPMFGMSAKAIVVAISCVLLCVGLVGMAFGVARRLRKKSLGIPEGVKERAKDTGYYIRCPNCGCPIGESRSVKSWASEKSKHTNASEKSKHANAPSYTHCPACACPLEEGSQHSSHFDITVSRAFRPGGSFLDLEEASNGGSSMGNLKMGDSNSPRHAAGKTPKSAIPSHAAPKTPKSALHKTAPKSALHKTAPKEPAHITSATEEACESAV